MNLTLSFLLNAATIASALISAPALPLETGSSSKGFRVELRYESPLLPINPTLASIMNFMGVVARKGYYERVQPRTYTYTMYPSIQITAHTSIEARYLLLGIDLAATEMVKFVRFNHVVVSLYWDNRLLGQISILTDTILELPGNHSNDSRNILSSGGGLTLVDINNKTETLGDTARKTLDADSAKSGSGNLSILSQVLPDAPLSAAFSLVFERVAGAAQLTRSDVFLSFYSAILVAAKFPVGDRLLDFNSKAPTVDLLVHMYDTGIGCRVIIPSCLKPVRSNVIEQC